MKCTQWPARFCSELRSASSARKLRQPRLRGQRNGFDHRTDLLQGWESVSSASIEEPVIVPASERIPNRSGTGATLIDSSPPAPATMSWPRLENPCVAQTEFRGG